MRIQTIGLALAAGLTMAAGAAHAQVLDIPDLDHSFVCPETLDRDQTPSHPSQSFMESVARAAPTSSGTMARLYWRQLLVQHRCAKSLDRIRAREEAIRDGAVEPQTWLSAWGDATANVSVSEDYLEPYVDPRDPGTAAIETYIRAAFGAARRTDRTGAIYDEVVSHVIYYCDVGERALIENDYFLTGRLVRKEPHARLPPVGDADIYETEQVAPKSLNAAGLHWICAGIELPPEEGGPP